MRGTGSAKLTAWAVAASFGALATPARAEPGVRLNLECPQLSDEQRSSLEARATADLAMKQMNAGELSVHCEPPEVRVGYVAEGGPIRWQRGRLSPETEAWVEQILELANLVTLAEPAAQAAAAPPSKPPLALASPAPVRRPIRSPASPPQRASGPTPEPRAPLRVEPGIGLRGEIWGNELPALLGPSASFGLRPSSVVRIDLVGTAAWGIETPGSIGVSQWQGALEVVFGRRFWFGAGAGLSAFRFTAERALSPDARTSLEPMLSLRGGAAVLLEKQAFAAGLGLQIYPRTRDVRVDDEPVYRTPFVALTLSVEYRFVP